MSTLNDIELVIVVTVFGSKDNLVSVTPLYANVVSYKPFYSLRKKICINLSNNYTNPF